MSNADFSAAESPRAGGLVQAGAPAAPAFLRRQIAALERRRALQAERLHALSAELIRITGEWNQLVDDNLALSMRLDHLKSRLTPNS